MKRYFFPALKLTIVLVLLTAGIYPLFVAGIAKLAPGKGDGVKVERNGVVVGYANVGQQFTGDNYFQTRPSAVGYNAAGSGGSNKGPSNPDYLKIVEERIDTFLAHNPGVKRSEIPAELVTASGSGLDPHLSPEGALVQVPRIAKVRNIPEQKLRDLVKANTKGPLAGMFGPATVNVLQLNLALDEIH
ncbi:K(+)-transporting ATPase subunit C [Chitinophaga rhizosphaerae]|uniref:K(+)-transporting ATPase subunit C n=1 Tax=Chitinophaga rhizosphaerae TaxID=1864947 RepID=UPI000F8094C8|nr:K(+)-transporting ATPase subunit C [Chitinophaga rhizosphaerae]